MKHQVTIGVVCFARKTFDYQAAAELYQQIQQQLHTIEQVHFEIIPELLIEIEETRQAAQALAEKRLDGLICISGTFHLGHLVLELNKALRVPILLWGLNELPYNGGKIRLNSVCGVNLDASNLYKAGTRKFHVTIGETVDEDWIDALRISAALSQARIGIAGFRAKGFFNLGVYDLNVYQQMGVLIDHYELQEIFNTNVTDEAVQRCKEKLENVFDVSSISAEQLHLTAQLAAKFERFMDAHHLTALALRCWPEFAAEYGIAPCAAMSLVQAEQRLIVCEGDIEGALSMIAHQAVGAKTPFLADLSQVNFEEDFALLWHCGVAPCNLWDGQCVRSLDSYHAGGKGVTADFVMKSGEISLLRIDSAGQDYRLFLQRGKGIPMEKELRGTYLKVQFEQPIETVMHNIIYNGVAHHASMVYGDYTKPFEVFARLQGWQIIK
jgi:L-fucose isomerase-like protein